MREIRTSGLMSGDGKRGNANMAQATAPVLDSTMAWLRADLRAEFWQENQKLVWRELASSPFTRRVRRGAVTRVGLTL
ncbi:MAG: hypothetical protein K0R61_4417 [Microvirga sp.]|jgi:hypothetical protein|nr:hypothetical protein [Microvirga sp.]